MKRFNFSLIIFLMGICMIANGLFVMVTSLVGLYYGDDVTFRLFLTASGLILSGAIMMFFTRNNRKEIKKSEGYLVVTLGWVFICVSGALPYIFTGVEPHFMNALFESVSGYTTTGSSIIDDIEALPKSILLWRSLTNWIGGMGIIVLTIAILPLLGIGGTQLFSAESPGASVDKIHPRIADTAKTLWLIYVGMTLLESLLLWGAGMSLFDAITHSMSTLSEGGFSTKNASVAYWNNMPVIQYIIIFFMFFGGVNFVLIYYVLKGRVQKLFRDEEFRFYSFCVISLGLITAYNIYTQTTQIPTDYEPLVWGAGEQAFRASFFQVISVITSCGFVTADYTSWTPFLKVLFFAIMFLGACAGSTSGGVKMQRHLLLIKNGWLNLKRMIHPNAIIPVRLNKKSVSNKFIYDVLTFFIFYMLTFIAGTLLLSFIGLDFETAIGTSVSSLGNIGPAFGKFYPLANFSGLNDWGKLWCSSLMLFGRLEILTVLILFSPYYWKRLR